MTHRKTPTRPGNHIPDRNQPAWPWYATAIALIILAITIGTAAA